MVQLYKSLQCHRHRLLISSIFYNMHIMNVYSPYIPISWLLPILDQISTGREKVHANHKLYRLYCAFTSLSFPGEAAPSSQQTWEGWRAIWSPRVDKFDRFDCDCSEWKLEIFVVPSSSFHGHEQIGADRGGLIFKVLFDGRSAYFSFKRYLAAKICFLKYPKIHNYISSCCIDPATVHAPSSTTKSCNSGRSFSSEDKAWRCSDTKHHLGQTSIRNSRELRQFAYHCYLWMQRVSRCALTVRCKNGNPGIDVSWVPPCEVFQSQ